MGSLYHYTSVQSFESIIKSQCIRMTRSDFMNDPHDCRAFYNIVKKYIETKTRCLDVAHYLNNVKSISNRYPEDVEELIRKYPLTDYLQYVYDHIPLYVFSLTDARDSLPMWNYYGNNGICLGFDQDSLLRAMAKNLCQKDFDFLAYTKIDYIDLGENLSSLPLDSLSDIQLYTSSSQHTEGAPYSTYLHEDRRDGKVNLESFVDSYIESYVVTVNYLLRSPKAAGESFEGHYGISSDNDFYRTIFIRNRELIKNSSLKFKADIDLFMLILSARYKPKTFENESETRIVFFRYDVDQQAEEQFTTVSYDFGAFIKPFIECRFDPSPEEPLSAEVRSIILSPATKRIPVSVPIYQKVLCSFLKKENSFDICVSKHDIRW